MNALIIALSLFQGFGNGNVQDLNTGEVYQKVGPNYMSPRGEMTYRAYSSGDRRPAYFDANGNYYHPTGKHDYINLKNGDYIRIINDE